MIRSEGQGSSMVGELLYHLHRHFRLVLIAGGLALVVGVSALGWEVVRHKGEPARPVEAGQA
ncbi:hypothetical protein [Brevundimonas sp.]|uniref:hypothetical protein n=1 Tax=Brevundimonas sp. TaxID=1871086 RepID=UPI0037BF29AA